MAFGVCYCVGTGTAFLAVESSAISPHAGANAGFAGRN
jgi:hypothetical protein